MNRSRRRYSTSIMEELAKRRLQEFRQKKRKELESVRQEILTSSGKGNVNNNQEGPYHPLEIIPVPAIWEKILGHLEDSKDVISAYYTCDMFREILEHKRVDSLLPEVLKVLAPDEIFEGRIHPHTKEMLKARLVSKSWKRCIEKVHFDWDYEQEDWYLKWTGPGLLRNDRLFAKPDVEKLINMIKLQPASLSTSPLFYCREISVVDTFLMNEAESNELHYAITQLLMLCGESMYCLNYESRRPFQIVYARILEWVSFLSNLKALIINNRNGFNQDEAYTEDHMRREVRQMEMAMRGTEFPFIPSLEYYIAQDIPASFSAKILKANKNVKSVYVREMDVELSRVLADLPLETIQIGKFENTQMSTIVYGSVFSWPLKMISIRYSTRVRNCSSHQLFQFLERFKETLEKVDVHVYMDSESESVVHYLDLQNVKELNWSLANEFNNIDFLAPCKSLEKLLIRTKREGMFNIPQREGGEIINFNGYLKDFRTSNIWRYFPALQSVMFGSLDNKMYEVVRRPSRLGQ